VEERRSQQRRTYERRAPERRAQERRTHERRWRDAPFYVVERRGRGNLWMLSSVVGAVGLLAFSVWLLLG
jgi:hypothetical protein